jgi:para-nitrobenzyl esterase
LCWRYWFDYVAEAEHATYINGAWHGNEVPYVFDTLGQVEPFAVSMSTNAIAVCCQVADYWVSFARDAGARDILPGPTHWPAAVKGGTLRIGVNKHAGFRLENRFMRARMSLFKRDEAPRQPRLSKQARNAARPFSRLAFRSTSR